MTSERIKAVGESTPPLSIGFDIAIAMCRRADVLGHPYPSPELRVWLANQITIAVNAARASSPTPDGVIKERDGRTWWEEGINYGLTQLCAVLDVDPSKVSWDAATETVEGDVRSVIGNILRAWAADDWQDLPTIREMLLEGQGDDDGGRILPDFQEGMTVHAMVAACVHLLERRRDAIEGYANNPSAQESGVGEAEGWVLVPREPTEAMWGGLARQIVMWTRCSRPTGHALHRDLKNCGWEVPAWLADEIPDEDRVPPKGSVAVAIYRAMIEAAPRPSQREG